MTTDINFYRFVKQIVDITNEIKDDPDALDYIGTNELFKFAKNLELLAEAITAHTHARVALYAQSRQNHPTGKGKE